MNIICASIIGENQGLISAGCGTLDSIGNKYKISHIDEICVLQFEHSMSQERSVVYHPIQFHKPIDKSSPLLSAALSENETLQVAFKFYRVSVSGYGHLEHFYTVALNNARLLSISLHYSHVQMNTVTQPEDIIVLSYDSISWKHVAAGSESHGFLRTETAS